MGIRGLHALINYYVPWLVETYHYEYFSGSKIAIDTSILLYKCKYASSINDKKNSHLYRFLKRCLNYVKNGIIPVFVLDGKPPPEKYKTIENRNKKKQKIKAKIDELKENMSDGNRTQTLLKIEKLSKQIIYVSSEDYKDIKELLTYLGFNVILSPQEAENICVSLQRDGHVDYTYSDDTDIFALGCEKILRTNTHDTYSFFSLQSILDGLKLTYNQFVDLCILCGCDYCPNIPRINQYKAYELIKKYKTIENVIKQLKTEQYYIPTHFDYISARELFSKPDTVKYKVNSIQIKELQEYNLKEFLKKKNISQLYTKNFIRNFKKYVQLINQKNIYK